MDLKPCPFCGGEANLKYESEDTAKGYEFHNIYCRKCGAQFWVNSKDEAIQKWNNRNHENGEDGIIRLKVELDTEEAEQRLSKMANDIIDIVKIIRGGGIE